MFLNIFEQRENDNNVHKYFKKPDFGGQIAFMLSGASNVKVGGITPLSDKLQVKQMKADFYGMARRGNTWKGVRLVID